jgi:hypothetical protein
LLGSFQKDLSACDDSLESHKVLKNKVIAMFHKFTGEHRSVQGRRDSVPDSEKLNEKVRRREYLEKCVESFKAKLRKSSATHNLERSRLMKDNANLTITLNELKRELHYTQMIKNSHHPDTVEVVVGGQDDLVIAHSRNAPDLSRGGSRESEERDPEAQAFHLDVVQ